MGILIYGSYYNTDTYFFWKGMNLKSWSYLILDSNKEASQPAFAFCTYL